MDSKLVTATMHGCNYMYNLQVACLATIVLASQVQLMIVYYYSWINIHNTNEFAWVQKLQWNLS